MNPTWSMLDGDVVLTKQVQPSTLLAYGLGRFHEISQYGMVSSDNYWPSKEMLPVHLRPKTTPRSSRQVMQYLASAGVKVLLA